MAMQSREQSSLDSPETGVGVMPFGGKFTRFRGCVRYDPSTTDGCEVMLQIEAASLAMANEPVRDEGWPA
jgi:polyisoprenoid-binding protein YceI